MNLKQWKGRANKKKSGKQKFGRLTAHPYLRKTPIGGRMMASKISQKVGPRGEKSSSESHLAIFSWFSNTRLSLSCKKKFWDENSPRISHKPRPPFLHKWCKTTAKERDLSQTQNKQQNQGQKKKTFVSATCATRKANHCSENTPPP
jgi:hypothetical protein